MMTESTIKELRRIMIDNHRCFGCGHEHSCGTRGCAIMRNAADTLEAQQARIAELEAELREEMYRHDRVQDFEVAEAQELAKLREERRWIPVGERLPEEGENVLVFGYWHEKFQPLMCYLSPHRKGEWFTSVAGQQVYTVTHWMPLPEVDG